MWGGTDSRKEMFPFRSNNKPGVSGSRAKSLVLYILSSIVGQCSSVPVHAPFRSICLTLVNRFALSKKWKSDKGKNAAADAVPVVCFHTS